MFSFINAIVLFLLVHRLLRTSVCNTFPIRFQDALESTWSCDNIRKYQILVSNDQPKMLVTHVAGRAQKQFQITQLDPSTEYCISIRFQNNAGFYSPVSPQKCVTTPATGKVFFRNVHNTSLFLAYLQRWFSKFIFDFFKFKDSLLITMMVVFLRRYKNICELSVVTM